MTVPAYFNDSQRLATKDSGSIYIPERTIYIPATTEHFKFFPGPLCGLQVVGGMSFIWSPAIAPGRQGLVLAASRMEE